jgi:DNA repair protein RecO (recombination protein O)
VASFVTEAIVTGARRYGEADKLVTLLTRARGRLTAIAKSARKPKSSLRGATEPFVRAKFELAEGRSLDIVRQTEIIDAHLGLRGSWRRLQLAGHVAEIANRMGEERFPDPELYDLLSEAIDGISEGVRDAVVRFKVGLLYHMGVFPDLSGCAKCGASRTRGNVHLDMKGHGFLCGSCAKALHVYHPVPMKVLHVLHSYRNGGDSPQAVDESLIDTAEDVLTAMLQAFLQQGFKTSQAARQARAGGNKPDKKQGGESDTKSGGSPA